MYPISTPLSPHHYREAIDALQAQNFRRHDVVEGVAMDCLSFVIRVYETVGDARTIPRFSTTQENLAPSVVPFAEMNVGDILLLKRKRIAPSDTKRINRIFTHLGIKYDDERVAHVSDKLRVEPLKKLLQSHRLLVRETLTG